ncbi:MAG: fluoride efflux transporter CrcB [Georgenia sp.]
MTALFVALGAAAGAPARYLTDRVLQERLGSQLPWGTLCVNVLGSLLLGLVLGGAHAHGVGAATVAAVGKGFSGALTTFSTFGYETVRLVEDGSYRYAVGNVVVSVVVGLLAAWAGWQLGLALLG